MSEVRLDRTARGVDKAYGREPGYYWVRFVKGRGSKLPGKPEPAQFHIDEAGYGCFYRIGMKTIFETAWVGPRIEPPADTTVDRKVAK